MPKKMIDYDFPYYVTLSDEKVKECKTMDETLKEFDKVYKHAEVNQSVCMFRKKYRVDEEDKLIQYRFKVEEE